MSDTKNSFTERSFTYPHNGYIVNATIWNEIKDPHVLYDYNNVLNTFTLETLEKAANTEGKEYAIVSLLRTKGDNYNDLKQMAMEDGECIVALTLKFRGNRVKIETGLKYKVIKLLRWKNVECALDDKPHEWYSDTCKKSQDLKLDHHKKPVYMVKLKKN